MNYYAILGVGPGASVAEIKRAYRRLARRHHPGINPGDRESEELFQRVSEAYETLVDPERRRRYDATGHRSAAVRDDSFEFTGFDFTVAAQGAQAATFSELFADVLHPVGWTSRTHRETGADLHAAVTLSFEEAFHGVERQIVVTRLVACAACEGAGEVTTAGGSCPHCGGSGQVRWARRHMVFTRDCPVCGGSGREKQRKCSSCAGEGRAVRGEHLRITIPPGVRNDARIRIPAQGHAGSRGGPSGDLYIDVQVQPHEFIRREGDDLHVVLPVAIHEAALGARIVWPFIDGPVQMRIPPGTQAGRRIRVAGRGAPSANGSRGDLWVEVQLAFPESLDERSKDLLREFGRLNSTDIRRGIDGAFRSENHARGVKPTGRS